jgi:membrane dipeptidase
VEKLAREHPDDAVICRTADEVRTAAREGKAALLMGVEGAHALGTDDPEQAIRRIRTFHQRGVRYMTLTWSNDNPLGHSSSGEEPSLGLTELGRRAVREMNRLGMIVDVSHVSDQTFWDIMDVSRRPVFASHSSVRSLSDHPRNMTDDMIRRVAEGGGAICLNYFSQFIDVAYRDRRRALHREHAEQFEALEQEHDRYMDRGAAELTLALELDPDIAPPDLRTLGDHFQKVVELGGPEAACLGSDFDGISELPVGMEDVSDLGALRAELERRGLPIRPIFGENVLRVLSAQSGPAPTSD